MTGRDTTGDQTGDVVRTDRDGAVNVVHIEGDLFGLGVFHDGEEGSIVCTEYNARRLLGALSVMLGLPLSREASKKVKMG